ncbi:MAG TPA: hypothetical protein VFV24_03470, partial [Candidatus Eisenbacteria bacterium]|nr:hypothetical protein [Candidatus Eisenbacteria bacterium]
MTRLTHGDATSEFVATLGIGSPGWIAGVDTVEALLSLHVLAGASTGTVTIDARAVAVESITGVAVADESAETPLAVTILPGGITAEASQVPATVRPGDRARALLQLSLQNQFPSSRTVTSIRLTNATAGPGDVDQRDAELGDVSLYADDGDGTLEATDTLLLSTVALGGSITFAPLDRSIPAGSTLHLLAVANVPLGVRDGDILDLSVLDSAAVAIEEPAFFRNGWPLAPAGGFAVDGMVAAQAQVRPVPTGSFVAGSDDNVALEVLLPPNGYEFDRLVRLGVTQLGSAIPVDDIERVRAWVDTGDRKFDATTDRLLGDLIFTGDRWQRTGLSETVPIESLRVYVTVDLADLARQDRTIRLGVSQGTDGGVGMLSGNSGPLDRAIENPFHQTVSISDRVTWSATALGPMAAPPGAQGLVLLQLGGTNSYASNRTLTALTVTNATAGPGGAALRDGETEALTLRADGNGDGLLGDPSVDPVLGTSFFTAGRAAFSGLSLLLPAGGTRNLFVVADLSLSEARDGDAIGATLAAVTDLGYLEPTTTTALWPLDSGRRVLVDGMISQQIGTVGPSAVTLGPGDGPVLAFDFLLPRNGYESDVLQGVRVVNLGTAGTSDIAELRLWADGGDGQFTGTGDDRDLGPLVPLGGAWTSALLTEPL